MTWGDVAQAAPSVHASVKDVKRPLVSPAVVCVLSDCHVKPLGVLKAG